MLPQHEARSSGPILTIEQPSGPPYIPQIAQLGLVPTPIPDDPISAVLPPLLRGLGRRQHDHLSDQPEAGA